MSVMQVVTFGVAGAFPTRMSVPGTPLQPPDHLLLEIERVHRSLSHGGWLKILPLRDRPTRGFSDDDRRFLNAVAGVLIPATALRDTGIDVLENIEHMLGRASIEHQIKAQRIVAWARRLSPLYGGERMPLRARQSRFIVVQKLAHAVSSLCLVAFWADEAAFTVIESPPIAKP
jgi:hypothetical protein